MSMNDGAMGAGAADAPDIGHKASGDATGGGDPGNQDDMGADDGRTVDEGAGRTSDPDDVPRTGGQSDDVRREQ